MRNPVPPLILPNAALTVARARSILSTNLAVLSPPIEPTDVVNKQYLEGNITTNTYPRSVLYTSDPSGSIKGISKFTYDDTIDTVYLDGNLTINSTTVSMSLNGGRITGLGTPILNDDAATKAYVDSHSGGSGSATGPNLSVQYNLGGSFAGSSYFEFDETLGRLSVGLLDIIGGGSGGNTVTSISGLDYPINASDAANKAYVDAAIGSAPGLPFDSIQFNSSGIFGGTSDFTFNGNTVNIAVSTPSTSTATGSLVVAGGVGVGGSVFIGGTCNADDFLTTSDKRLKSNINRINDEDVSRLLQLNGYTYHLKNQPDLKYGLMAQEIEHVGFENFVKEVGDHKKVNYQFFIPVLIESIKNLTNRINELELGTRETSD